MLKTIKGKVIAGTVSVVLLSSAGAAFASSNAGVVLKNWYDGQFGSSSSSVKANWEEYGLDKKEVFEGEVENLKTVNSNVINRFGLVQTSSANKEINSAVNEHVDSVNYKKKEIADGMAAQFDQLSLNATTVINNQGNQALIDAESTLSEHTSDVGGKAHQLLNDELETSTETAVAKLEAAINGAKTSLQNQLDRESAATTKEIKGIIDAKLKEVRDAIATINEELVQEQKDCIEGAALLAVKNAKQDLQDVVNGIDDIEVIATTDGI